jgi:presenilin-like A22 family membrane protease
MPAVAALGAIFTLSILGGIAISALYGAEYQVFGPDVNNPVISLEYIALILLFTAGILLAARYLGGKFIKVLFLGITGFTIYFVLRPVISVVFPGDAAEYSALGIAVAFTVLLWRYPEWWVIDASGILMSVGLCAILGISFGILPALLLLALLAVYDAIAVYRTKHMIALADTVMSESLPIMFVIPKRAGYSFLKKRKSLKEQIASGEEREALFMGLGDVIIPGALVVSAFTFLAATPPFYGVPANLAVALVTLAGGIAGFSALMYFVLKGNPQAGLPLLNGGTIASFLIGSLAVYGRIAINL